MEAFGWAYIGNGNIAASTAKDILRGSHKIISVYGRNAKKAQAFAQRVGARSFASAKEALTCSGVQGAYIATPHTSHLEYALSAMQLGVPVLCEKPVAVCEADVRRLIDASRQYDVYFCEAMWTWFSDVALTVKKWVQGGEIGRIKSVEIHYAFPGVMLPKNSRVLTPQTAGGALLDIGIYPITYCYNLFGMPEKISCRGRLSGGIDVSETVVLSYPGFECKLCMSLRSLRESCVIRGEKGTISLPGFFHMASKAVLKNNNGRRVFCGKTDYLTEFSRAAQEITSGKKQSDYIPFSATLSCMRIMDECRRQMGLVYPFEKDAR